MNLRPQGDLIADWVIWDNSTNEEYVDYKGKWIPVRDKEEAEYYANLLNRDDT